MVGEINSVQDESNDPIENGDGDEEMENNQIDDEYDSQDDESGEDDKSNDIQAKKVRDRIAYIDIPLKGENDTMIFSYHYKYEKYLRDHNPIDPEKAKIQQEKMK